MLCPLRICTRYTKLLNHDYATYINDRWNLLLAQTLNVILPSSPKRAFKGELEASQMTVLVGLLPWFELLYTEHLWCLSSF